MTQVSQDQEGATAADGPPGRVPPPSTGAVVGVAASVVVAVVAVFWATGWLAPDLVQHMVSFGIANLVLLAFIVRGTRAQPRLRRVAIATVLGTSIALLAVMGWMSRPTAVDEEIVVAERRMDDAPAQPADADTQGGAGQAAASGDPGDGAAQPEPAGPVLVADGSFEPRGKYSGSGTASLVRLEDGSHVVTFADFEVSSGPDLFVYLVAGSPESDRDVTEHVNLGDLKGTSGNQQYEVPADVDLERYDEVWVWCRLFAVGFLRAQLT